MPIIAFDPRATFLSKEPAPKIPRKWLFLLVFYSHCFWTHFIWLWNPCAVGVHDVYNNKQILVLTYFHVFKTFLDQDLKGIGKIFANLYHFILFCVGLILYAHWKKPILVNLAFLKWSYLEMYLEELLWANVRG